MSLSETPLTALHRRLGARMGAFAGYDMPIQFPMGVLKEHLHTRAAAGLFDVSHMGQAYLVPRDKGADGALLLERLVPGDLVSLKPWRMRYTLLTDAAGGVLDDLMVLRAPTEEHPGRLFIVVNAATAAADFSHIGAHLAREALLEVLEDRALIALQGPGAAGVLAPFAPDLVTLPFMGAAEVVLRLDDATGVGALVSRSGYTGEDGFEISLAAGQAEAVAELLLADPRVAPIGLGARDSLRLEAGLCLYGHDLDPKTTPVEAALSWTIGKARRTGGARAGGFPGADRILGQIDGAVPLARLRVGLAPEGRAPLREGVALTAPDGSPAGEITSGGFGPSADRPVAMGFVRPELAAPGTPLTAEQRGRSFPLRVAELPFVPHRFHRG